EWSLPRTCHSFRPADGAWQRRNCLSHRGRAECPRPQGCGNSQESGAGRRHSPTQFPRDRRRGETERSRRLCQGDFHPLPRRLLQTDIARQEASNRRPATGVVSWSCRYPTLKAFNSASQGGRYGRTSIFATSESPMIASLSASQRIVRPKRKERLARWQALATRWPLSKSEIGVRRDFTQSRKLRACCRNWARESPDLSSIDCVHSRLAPTSGESD